MITAVNRHILTLSLILTFSILLTFSLNKTSYPPNHHLLRRHTTIPVPTFCNHSNGKWIYDKTVMSPRYNASTCREIYKGWNCLGNSKSNVVDVFKWRWKPHQCVLPEFDPVSFFNAYRDSSIGNSLFWIPPCNCICLGNDSGENSFLRWEQLD